MGGLVWPPSLEFFAPRATRSSFARVGSTSESTSCPATWFTRVHSVPLSGTLTAHLPIHLIPDLDSRKPRVCFLLILTSVAPSRGPYPLVLISTSPRIHMPAPFC